MIRLRRRVVVVTRPGWLSLMNTVIGPFDWKGRLLLGLGGTLDGEATLVVLGRDTGDGLDIVLL